MSRRRIIFIIIIFVVLLVATVISYYIPSNPWKEYTNDAWGVSFHYPSSFEKKEYHAADVAFLGAGGTIDLFMLPEKLDPNNMRDSSGEIAQPLKTLVGDRVGYTFSQTRDDCNEKIVQTAVGARTLRIAFITCKGEQYPIDRDTTFINRVLKTFRFVDRGSGWKTYLNTAHGYHIDYPEGYTIEEKGDTVGFLAPWEIATRAMPNYTDQPLGYYITMYAVHPKYSLEQWLQGKYKDCDRDVCTIEGTRAMGSQVLAYLVHEGGLAEGSYSIFRKDGDKIFEFTTFWGFEINNEYSTFNTMLRSFHLE
ncbi:hypothetical protein HY624_00115 [Candidatus Uhrbacteria bacterium]|nr:hypothetical protein [Candidatus Uhrbacteria bacterium]